MSTRKFKIIDVTCTMFLLESAVLEETFGQWKVSLEELGFISCYSGYRWCVTRKGCGLQVNVNGASLDGTRCGRIAGHID